MSLRYVLEPIKIGLCSIPNRIVFTAHTTGFARGLVSDRLIAYHEARAKGGVGLAILEILSVHPTSPAGLRASAKELVESYQRLMAAVRPHGTKVFQQLWHGGHHAIPLDGSPPWSASDIPSVAEGVVPQPMTHDQIQEITEAYANAARLCEEGGLDGVELHGAHGFLIQQFMSPLTNRRTDEYGDSFENRIRFKLQVLRAIRTAVSNDFVVGIRLSPEMTPGGLDSDENAGIAKVLQGEGLVDFINVSMGGHLAFPKLIGGLHEPMGYELPTSSPITAATTLPTIVTGRFRTLDEADQIIKDGVADLVGMTRAHIADPNLIAKTRDGRPEEVRPCIGCNQGCVGELLGPLMRISCTVNIAVGKEHVLGEDKLERAKTPKNILVVGGGPSGMEAARVAALRGHRVLLMEAGSRLGGTINLLRAVPRLQGLCDIIDWQINEIHRLGVEVRNNVYVEAEDVKQILPDAVIIATGSTPRLDGIQSAIPGQPATGVDQSHVLSSVDLLSSPGIPLGETAVVVDDVGHYESVGVAEYLIEKGLAVTFVTHHKEFAPLMQSALRAQPALERLGKGNFSLMTRAQVLAIRKKDVVVKYLYGGPNRVVPADTVVLVSHNRPECSLKNEIKDFCVDIHLVGDAQSPRFLKVAIHEGYRAGSIV